MTLDPGGQANLVPRCFPSITTRFQLGTSQRVGAPAFI
jgi:hypothetical protein